MAHRCGTRAEASPPAGPGRWVLFVVSVGAAMALVAGVVLLPAYAALRRAEWERDCLAAQARAARAEIAAYDRMLDAAPDDPVLTKRLAITQLGLQPRREKVVYEGSVPRPAVLELPAEDAPTPPAAWVQTAASRLRRPRTRRGVLLLAAGMLSAALFGLFPHRGKNA